MASSKCLSMKIMAQGSSKADMPIIHDDLTNEDIRQAINASLREVNLSSSSTSTSSSSKVGLEAVADMVHPDLSKLTEEEQLLIAQKASEAELTEDEREYLRVLEESKKDAQPEDDMTEEEQKAIQKAIQESEKEMLRLGKKYEEVVNNHGPDSEDEDLNQILAKSMDPNEQINPQYQEHFRRLMPSGASAVPNLEDLERRRKSRQVTTMASRIAAKHPHQGRVLDTDAKFRADLKMALDESLKEVELERSVSMSPPPMNGFSRVARSGSQGTTQVVKRTPMIKPRTYTYKPSKKGRYRPIIIDGCNVGFAYGRNEAFVAKGLEIAYNYFKEKGYEDKDIVIIIKHIPKQYLSRDDEFLLEELDKIGVLHYCQGRFAGGERLQPDDDLFILNTAHSLDGIVLSNDRYKQYWDTHVKYRDIIRSRLINPTFIRDKLILPVDPLGKKGPDLEKFLRFDTD